jgi:hypothetical protein
MAEHGQEYKLKTTICKVFLMSGIRDQESGIRKSYRRLCRRGNIGGAYGFTSFSGAKRRMNF